MERPAIGFTNVNMYEMEGPDLMADLVKASRAAPKWAAEGRHFPDYCILDLQVYRPIGRWRAMPEPSPEVKGRLAAWTLCSDSTMLDEWNNWYDNTHVPNMLEVEGVAHATRWERVEPTPYGANHLALFDIDDDPLAVAARMVKRSGELQAQEQVHPKFCVAQAAVVEPVGSWAGVGYTEGAEKRQRPYPSASLMRSKKDLPRW